MSNMLDLGGLVSLAGRVRKGRVVSLADVCAVEVMVDAATSIMPCELLETGFGPLKLSVGDAVLLWTGDLEDGRGVVLGRIAVHGDRPPDASGRTGLGSIPPRLTIEADRDIVIKNRHAKLVLGADGDIEFIGASFTSRCQRVLKLFAPFIKLN